MGASTTNGSNGARKFEERELPVKLTEKELLARGDSMAECELAIETLKIERLQLNKRIKAQIDERGKLGHIIDREAEDRLIKCEWQPDYAKNVFRLVRLDTNEEVDTRAMTATDRQGVLSLDDDHLDDFDAVDDIDTPPPRKPSSRKPRATRKAATGRKGTTTTKTKGTKPNLASV